MQSVYAMLQSKSDVLDKEEKFLYNSVDKMLDLYVLILRMFVEVKNLENDIAYATADIANAKKQLAEGGDSSQLNKVIEEAEKVTHDAEAKLTELSQAGNYFTLIEEGHLTPAEFDGAMADLVNFLEYVGEPIKRDRESLGIWVLLFIVFFGFVAYLLKKEYWKDIH